MKKQKRKPRKLHPMLKKFKRGLFDSGHARLLASVRSEQPNATVAK